MAIAPDNEDYQLIQLKTRNSFLKIELLNFSLQTIDYLEGNTISGSITVDADADIRRACSVSLVINKKYLSVASDTAIWINRLIRIYQGIKNPRTSQIKWWNMGLFLIDAPTISYDVSTNTLNFQGLDLMSKLTDKRGGQLEGLTTLIPAGSSIADVVKSIITQLVGFKNYIVIDKGYTVPYDIKMETGATVYELLAKLRDLYSDWEMFFDTDGVFHFQPIPSGENEPIVMDFTQLRQQLKTSDEISLNFDNVKNNIIVWGRLLDDGTQVYANYSDTNSDSPYNIDTIGKINYIISDEQIYTNDLALQRAKYELYLHARLNDSITINCVPIPWLNDVNVKIYDTNLEDGINGEYLIKNLSIPLDVASTLTITAIKIYN